MSKKRSSEGDAAPYSNKIARTSGTERDLYPSLPHNPGSSAFGGVKLLDMMIGDDGYDANEISKFFNVTPEARSRNPEFSKFGGVKLFDVVIGDDGYDANEISKFFKVTPEATPSLPKRPIKPSEDQAIFIEHFSPQEMVTRLLIKACEEPLNKHVAEYLLKIIPTEDNRELMQEILSSDVHDEGGLYDLKAKAIGLSIALLSQSPQDNEGCTFGLTTGISKLLLPPESMGRSQSLLSELPKDNIEAICKILSLANDIRDPLLLPKSLGRSLDILSGFVDDSQAAMKKILDLTSDNGLKGQMTGWAISIAMEGGFDQSTIFSFAIREFKIEDLKSIFAEVQNRNEHCSYIDSLKSHCAYNLGTAWDVLIEVSTQDDPKFIAPTCAQRDSHLTTDVELSGEN